MIKKFSRFLGVGAVATAVQYALLFVLVEFAGTSILLASATGFTTSAIFNYFANFYFTFNCNRRHSEAFPKFFGVSAVGLFLNTATLHLFADDFGMHYLVAQLLSTVVVLLWNFEVNRRWTYLNVETGQQRNSQ